MTTKAKTLLFLVTVIVVAIFISSLAYGAAPVGDYVQAGPARRTHDNTNYSQGWSRTARSPDGTRIVATWSGADVHMRVFDGAWQPVSPAQRVNTVISNSANGQHMNEQEVAWSPDSSRFIIVFSSRYSTYPNRIGGMAAPHRIYDREGVPLMADEALSFPSINESVWFPRVWALADGRFAIVATGWFQEDAFLTIVDQGGDPLLPVRLNDPSGNRQNVPTVVQLRSGAIFAPFVQNQVANWPDINYRVVGLDLGLLSAELPLATPAGRIGVDDWPWATTSKRGLVVVCWRKNDQVWARRFIAEGASVTDALRPWGAEWQVSPPGTRCVYVPRVVVDASQRMIFAWEDPGGAGDADDAIRLVVLSPARMLLQHETVTVGPMGPSAGNVYFRTPGLDLHPDGLGFDVGYADARHGPGHYPGLDSYVQEYRLVP